MNTHDTNIINDSIDNPAPKAFPDDPRFNAAYQRRLAEIQAVKDEELSPTNLDVHAAVTTVFGALQEILAFRGEIAKMTHVDQKLVDGLEDYARATGEAHSRYVMALMPNATIVALNEQAVNLRERFRLEAHVLVHRGLIDPARLSSFRGLMGYKNVAFELIDWANLMRDSWSVIEGKSGLTIEEIQKAKELGDDLILQAGLREQAPAIQADAARVRHQALTLLLNAYDEVRRAIQFLRWREGDADTIAPSLFQGRPRKRMNAEETTPPVAAATPVATPPAAPAPIPQGFPGANPFIH